MRSFCQTLKKKVNNGLRVNGTLNKYKILLTHLRNFALIRYGYTDLSFNDLTSDCVQEFDYYLRDDQSLNHNTIWLYMIAFTTICRLAVSRKHLASNPFREYKNIKKDKDRGYLLRNELEQLVSFNCKKRMMSLLKIYLFLVVLQDFLILILKDLKIVIFKNSLMVTNGLLFVEKKPLHRQT